MLENNRRPITYGSRTKNRGGTSAWTKHFDTSFDERSRNQEHLPTPETASSTGSSRSQHRPTSSQALFDVPLSSSESKPVVKHSLRRVVRPAPSAKSSTRAFASSTLEDHQVQPKTLSDRSSGSKLIVLPATQSVSPSETLCPSVSRAVPSKPTIPTSPSQVDVRPESELSTDNPRGNSHDSSSPKKRRRLQDRGNHGRADEDTNPPTSSAQFRTKRQKAGQSRPCRSARTIVELPTAARSESSSDRCSVVKEVIMENDSVMNDEDLDVFDISRCTTPPSAPVPPVYSTTTTPRQATMWKALLDTETSSRTSISPKSTEAQRQPRRKLIDTLKKLQETHLSSDAYQASDNSQNEDETDSVSSTSEQDRSPRSSSVAQSSPKVPSRRQEHGARHFARDAPKITYAAQRSYLDEDMDGLDALLSQPLDSPVSAGSKVMHSSHLREVRDEEFDEGPMKSIHELRAAGGSTKFEDDMNHLMEDLQASGKGCLGRKRSALLELIAKSRNEHSLARIIHSEYDSRACRACAQDSDGVICFLIAGLSLRFLTGVHAALAADHLQAAGIFNILEQLLALDVNIRQLCKDRKTNMPKTAQGQVMMFASALVESGVSGKTSTDQLQLETVAMMTAERLLTTLRKAGNDSVLLTDFLLERTIRSLEDKSENTTLTALSLLESATIAPSCTESTALWTLERMASLITIFHRLLAEDSAVQTLVLRCILNLSNGSHKRSTGFSDSRLPSRILAMIQSGFDELASASNVNVQTPFYDSLVLALGVMINLGEMTASRVARIIETEKGNKKMQALTLTFIEGRRKAAEAQSIVQSQANVAYGYLAVMLSALCQDEALRATIQQVMPSKRLIVLIEAVQEFIAFHKAADRNAHEDDVWVAFTTRLEGIVQRL